MSSLSSTFLVLCLLLLSSYSNGRPLASDVLISEGEEIKDDGIVENIMDEDNDDSEDDSSENADERGDVAEKNSASNINKTEEKSDKVNDDQVKKVDSNEKSTEAAASEKPVAEKQANQPSSVDTNQAKSDQEPAKQEATQQVSKNQQQTEQVAKASEDNKSTEKKEENSKGKSEIENNEEADSTESPSEEGKEEEAEANDNKDEEKEDKQEVSAKTQEKADNIEKEAESDNKEVNPKQILTYPSVNHDWGHMHHYGPSHIYHHDYPYFAYGYSWGCGHNGYGLGHKKSKVNKGKGHSKDYECRDFVVFPVAMLVQPNMGMYPPFAPQMEANADTRQQISNDIACNDGDQKCVERQVIGNMAGGSMFGDGMGGLGIGFPGVPGIHTGVAGYNMAGGFGDHHFGLHSGYGGHGAGCGGYGGDGGDGGYGGYGGYGGGCGGVGYSSFWGGKSEIPGKKGKKSDKKHIIHWGGYGDGSLVNPAGWHGINFVSPVVNYNPGWLRRWGMMPGGYMAARRPLGFAAGRGGWSHGWGDFDNPEYQIGRDVGWGAPVNFLSAGAHYAFGKSKTPSPKDETGKTRQDIAMPEEQAMIDVNNQRQLIGSLGASTLFADNVGGMGLGYGVGPPHMSSGVSGIPGEYSGHGGYGQGWEGEAPIHDDYGHGFGDQGFHKKSNLGTDLLLHSLHFESNINDVNKA